MVSCRVLSQVIKGILDIRTKASRNMFFAHCVFFVLSVFLSSANCQCPNGFVHHDQSCYFFETSLHEPWAEAREYCRSMTATLAIVEAAREHNFLKERIPSLQASQNVSLYPGFWLDGSDLLVEGEWMWMGVMKPITFSAWYPGFPDNLGKQEHCLEMQKVVNYAWNDRSCDDRLNFICEKNLTITDPPIIG